LYADMHVHTTRSDGTLSPGDTVAEAKRAGLGAVGIADHDTMSGIEEAEAAGHRLGVEVIPAAEINSDLDGAEVHILAYYPRHSLEDALLVLRGARVDRMEEMVSKLGRLGFRLPLERVLDLAGDAAPGRPHLARVMEEMGYVRDTEEAFDKYLAAGRPGYVGRTRPSPEQAVRLILDNGGVPVLAHPGLTASGGLLRDLLKSGLMGIEVFHPSHSHTDVMRYSTLCSEKGLLVTGGSDSHGPGSGRVPLGTVRVPYDLVERLKEASGRLAAQA